LLIFFKNKGCQVQKAISAKADSSTSNNSSRLPYARAIQSVLFSVFLTSTLASGLPEKGANNTSG
jgi:hypothetical protein